MRGDSRAVYDHRGAAGQLSHMLQLSHCTSSPPHKTNNPHRQRYISNRGAAKSRPVHPGPEQTARWVQSHLSEITVATDQYYLGKPFLFPFRNSDLMAYMYMYACPSKQPWSTSWTDRAEFDGSLGRMMRPQMPAPLHAVFPYDKSCNKRSTAPDAHQHLADWLRSLFEVYYSLHTLTSMGVCVLLKHHRFDDSHLPPSLISFCCPVSSPRLSPSISSSHFLVPLLERGRERERDHYAHVLSLKAARLRIRLNGWDWNGIF